MNFSAIREVCDGEENAVTERVYVFAPSEPDADHEFDFGVGLDFGRVSTRKKIDGNGYMMTADGIFRRLRSLKTKVGHLSMRRTLSRTTSRVGTKICLGTVVLPLMRERRSSAAISPISC